MCGRYDHPPYEPVDVPESVVRFNHVRAETQRQLQVVHERLHPPIAPVRQPRWRRLLGAA